MMEPETQFVFDKSESLATNFHRWNDLDSKERDTFNEPQLDRLAAIKLFSEIFGVSAVDIQDSMEVERRRYEYKP
jgi:hypothetical protein